MQTRIEDYRPMSYNDDMILHKIATRNTHSKTFKLALKQYKTRISENRLYFLHNRGSLAAFLCNQDANRMEKLLNLTLAQKGFNV